MTALADAQGQQREAGPADPGNASPPQASAQQPAPAQPQSGIVFQVGETTVKFGGYVKVDLIHDFDEIGSQDSFDPRQIPTNDESDPGMSTRMHARQTRLNLDVRSPTSIGPGRLFVEGDFFGEGNAFRLRHAYGTINGFLVGQTWSTFMDDDALPETLDFESPIGFPQIRQAQARYTHELGDGSYFAVAIEDPQSSILTPTGIPGDIEEAIPDLTGRLRWKHGLGHTQLGLFGGMARFNPDSGPAQNEILWGANLSTRIDVGKQNNVIAQATYGPGAGRYRGAPTAAPDANGDIEAVTVVALMAAYQHHWSEDWRSNITYSWAKGDLPDGVPADTTEQVSYLAVNLIWQFCNKGWCGVEYLYGTRDAFDDSHGEANRIQFSFRYDF